MNALNEDDNPNDYDDLHRIEGGWGNNHTEEGNDDEDDDDDDTKPLNHEHINDNTDTNSLANGWDDLELVEYPETDAISTSQEQDLIEDGSIIQIDDSTGERVEQDNGQNNSHNNNDNNNSSSMYNDTDFDNDKDNEEPKAKSSIVSEISTQQQQQNDYKPQFEVIELIDDSENDDNDNDDDSSIKISDVVGSSSNLNYVQTKKKARLDNNTKLDERNRQQNYTAVMTNNDQLNKTNAAALASFVARSKTMPNWNVPQHNNNNNTNHQQIPPPIPVPQYQQSANFGSHNSQVQPKMEFDVPQYIPFPVAFQPTWAFLAPSPQEQKILPTSSASTVVVPTVINGGTSAVVPEKRSYRLSLLNINEFTITGLPTSWSTPPTSVTGLRLTIKKVSRDHGNAYFERDKEAEGGGKWRIPLGAYHAFVAVLTSEPNTLIEPIPQRLLQLASLEKAREEKGYPDAKELIDKKVPEGLANALAPFQCGGVDFVLSKHGRALIADDMGLGKSIQGVASMSAYRSEWPLLVLCPSGARYHWENEFKHWLGVKSSVNKDYISNNKSVKESLLRDNQIFVVPNSKSPLLPSSSVRVVICSYGLAPVLVESRKLSPGMFRCAIVDESHMLKNKLSKRTSLLLPILRAMSRCVLLSGTPALARPAELWPQLSILAVEKEGWWDNEDDFMDKYVKKGGAKESAELHTLLRGTIMIRRLKNDILKTLPKKRREKADVHVVDDPEQKEEFAALLVELRQGKGQMGKLARRQYGEDGGHSLKRERRTNPINEYDTKDTKTDIKNESMKKLGSKAQEIIAQRENDDRLNKEYQNCLKQLDIEIRNQFKEGKAKILQTIAQTTHNLDDEQKLDVITQLEGGLRSDLEQEYSRRYKEIRDNYKDFLERVEGGMYEGATPAENITEDPSDNEEPRSEKRVTVLSRLYSLTGDVKIPLIVDMLKRWLEDPAKGKLCIFAHHISVLDALEEETGLSNVKNSTKKFIRIDGQTLPKQRQDQINMFQTDPQVRIALLGITAAGVAVTLTASSTVWFAELFWTPAIMIQAEDRCHRIGQQARVKCLYFVAKGTLDDILWKLIEKKFQEIGEFVEGKEKLKMVVDHTYHGTKELYKMFSYDDDDDSQVGSDDEDAVGDEFENQLLAKELEDDINQLGQEEEKMLLLEETDDNDGDGLKSDNAKLPAVESHVSHISLGTSENAAIALLDDDDDDNNNDGQQEQEGDWVNFESNVVHNMNVPLLDCQLYNVLIGDSRLGVDVCLFQQRLVIRKINAQRYDRLGPHSKPSVGDVLVAINGNRLSLISELFYVLQYIQKLLRHPPVQLTFIEIPSFKTRYKAQVMKEDTNLIPRNGFGPDVARSSSSGKQDKSSAAIVDLSDDQ